MAKLIESRARTPVKEVREFEAARCMTLEQAARFEGVIEDGIRKAETAFTSGAREWWPDLRNLYLVRLYLRTGLRRFELAKVRLGDIRPDQGELWVTGKNNLRDYVPLTASTLRLVNRWVALKAQAGEPAGREAFLFASPRGGPLSFGTIRLAWKAALKGAGLPAHFGVHTARHTAGLIVLATTGSLEKTQRFLRHRSIRTTERYYTHVDADQLRKELGTAPAWQ